ncbi:hypothetical protein BH11PLA2_BH11PLA2_08420 [soil metagenome]
MFRIAIAVALFATTVNAYACPFCGTQGQTLTGEVGQADVIVVGVMKNAKQNLEDPGKSTTELHITTVVKDHPYLNGRKVLVLNRYQPEDPTNPDAKYLIFAGLYPKVNDVALAGLVSGVALANFKDYTFDPYRGDPIGNKGELAVYLKGAIEVKDKPVTERLLFYFNHLDAQELTIGADAFLEFGNADYKDVSLLAPKLPADKLLAWLNDPNTPPSRFGLYGMLLGHSGRKSDAIALRKLLDEPKKLYSSGIDGMLAGYIILDPVEGWKYLNELIKDPKKDFQSRYAGLRTLRFFWDFRPDVIKKAELLDGMKSLMAHTDMADMPIKDLRKRDCLEVTPDVLAFTKQPAYMNAPIIRRAVVEYLLAASPKNSDAKLYIEEIRKTKPEWVKVAEESLEFDKDTSTKK